MRSRKNTMIILVFFLQIVISFQDLGHLNAGKAGLLTTCQVNVTSSVWRLRIGMRLGNNVRVCSQI